MVNLVIQKLMSLTHLTGDDRRLLETHANRIVHLDAHEDLIKDGDNPRYVNLILEGWACRYKQLEDGRRQIVSFFVPGDMCDPMVFLLKEMSHALGSLTAIKVARLTRDDMNRLISQSPNLARAFWLDMLLTAEVQRECIVNLGRRTALERMAHLFCELPLRLKMVGLSDGSDCELPVTQADLGDALGLSAVHVNRTLQELRATGFVELKGRRLTINDETGLRRLAMFDPTYLHLQPPESFS